MHEPKRSLRWILAVFLVSSTLALPLTVRAQDEGYTTNAGGRTRPIATCDPFTKSVEFYAGALPSPGYTGEWVAYRWGIYHDLVGWLGWGDANLDRSDWEWIYASQGFVSAPVPGAGPNAPTFTHSGTGYSYSRLWGPFSLGSSSGQGYAVLVEYYWSGSGATAWAWANQWHYRPSGQVSSYWCNTAITLPF